MKIDSLKPSDIAVALALAMVPGASLSALASITGRSIGEVHNAIRRLNAGRLLKPERREVVREPLLKFLQWGMPVAFPAQVGGITRGLATARVITANKAVGDEADTMDPAEFVWPDASGPSRGQALIPLYPAAPGAALKDTGFWTLLALVDLVRVGGAREQALALSHLERILTQERRQLT